MNLTCTHRFTYVQNEINGEATLTRPDGSQEVLHFNQGSKHGQAEEHFKDGQIRRPPPRARHDHLEVRHLGEPCPQPGHLHLLRSYRLVEVRGQVVPHHVGPQPLDGGEDLGHYLCECHQEQESEVPVPGWYNNVSTLFKNACVAM